MFKKNTASKNAKLIHTYSDFKIELWIDKHYEKRRIYGDDNGARSGIEEDTVVELLKKSFRHLIDIYLKFPKFKFINYPENQNNHNKQRLVLRKITHETLNVVVEIHYLSASRYEITVITAMQVDEFKIADGQYVFTLSKTGVSLKRKILNQFQKIY